MKLTQLPFHQLLLLVVGLLLSVGLYGQSTVSGTILDTEGVPLIGASVVEAGTSNGTITDVDGKFELRVSTDASLEISYLGYQPQTVALAGRTQLSITMEADNQVLDEVVVVGFATQKRENLTGSVSSIRFDDVVTQPVSNPAQLLYGRVAGVQLEQNAGAPGAAPSITVRGPNINNSNPLIVVDGIQVSSFNEISPSDIETFTVLKDAASAAIYGAQGANGVILITTKSGKSGKLKFTYNGAIGQQRPVDLPELLTGGDYARAMNEREFFEGSGAIIYSDDLIRQIENGTANPEYFGTDDWFGEAFQPALFTDHYLSANGGSQNARYLLSMRYNRQEGTLFTDDALTTYNVRAKIDVDATNWLTLGVNMVGNYRDNNLPSQSITGDGAFFRGIMQNNPLQRIQYSNGDYSGALSLDGVTPEPANNELFNQTIGENFVDNFALYTQLFAKVKILPGLTFEPAFVHNFSTTFERRFNPTFQLFDGPDREVVTVERALNNLFQDAGYGNNYQVDNLIRYARPGNNKHYYGVLVGHQLIVDNNFGNLFNARVENFATNDLRGLTNGVASTLTATGGAPTERVIQSFFSRVEYRFDERYLLELNVRFDGGSQFPTSDRYGFFPALSAGWRISEESFFGNLKETVSSLKLRGSWGRLGSLNSLSLYPFQQTFSVGNDYIFGNDDGTLTDGAAINSLANSDLKWEETETYNIGVDFELWSKFNVSVDWYQRNTEDILLRLPIPIIVGDYQAPFVNAGEVRNQGFEIAAVYQDRLSQDFNFNIGVNLSTNTNEVLSLPGIEGGEIIQGNQILRVGSPLYSYYGLVFDGIYQSEAEVEAGPNPVDGGTTAGYRRYLDVSGPDGEPDGRVDTNNDRAIIGNSFPDLVYGINASLNFKGIDLAVIFSGVSGVDRLRPQNGNDPDQGNLLTVWLDRWSPTNPSNEFPVVGSDRQFSSWDVVDGSYFRLKLAELGYTLPAAATQRLGLSRIRLYVSGTNLFTITDFVPGFDPEKARGNRRNEQYPLNQNYVFGVNVNF